jgi:hypothetical protein
MLFAVFKYSKDAKRGKFYGRKLCVNLSIDVNFLNFSGHLLPPASPRPSIPTSFRFSQRFAYTCRKERVAARYWRGGKLDFLLYANSSSSYNKATAAAAYLHMTIAHSPSFPPLSFSSPCKAFLLFMRGWKKKYSEEENVFLLSPSSVERRKNVLF